MPPAPSVASTSTPTARAAESGWNTSRFFALGPLCGVSDPAVVLRAAQACDLAGIDTITTGATIAFLMECAENGLISGRLEGSGRPLRFGDGEAVLEAIEALLNRRGAVGELLALGSRGRPSASAVTPLLWPLT